MATGLFIVGVLIVCFTSQFFLGPDNKLEEVSEDVIEHNTGIKVDGSPGTPEKKEKSTD